MRRGVKVPKKLRIIDLQAIRNRVGIPGAFQGMSFNETIRNFRALQEFK